MVNLSPILTIDRIRSHESQWRLDECRVPDCRKPIYYFRVKVVSRLTELGIVLKSV